VVGFNTGSRREVPREEKPAIKEEIVIIVIIVIMQYSAVFGRGTRTPPSPVYL
jgi:hypothetical protein